MAEDVGKVGWIDMTVDNADELRDFYSAVVGLRPHDVDMGGYADYSMLMRDSDDAVCGICHARGSNADLPSGWLIYFIVDDVDAAAASCTSNGGKIAVAPRDLAGGRFCVIEDPSGATAALYQS